jgi:hypothetical protein
MNSITYSLFCCRWIHIAWSETSTERWLILHIVWSIVDEYILLDLKHLLREAKQKIPPFLANMQSENEKYLDLGGKSLFIYIHTYNMQSENEKYLDIRGNTLHKISVL